MNDWNMIRAAYREQLPKIMEARAWGKRCRTSPYFIDWLPMFTPIESYAWQDIRANCLPLYPQFPVDNVFIDFADPYLRIGVELDGKEYHEHGRDLARDGALWAKGWRIFRVRGRNSLPSPSDSSPIGNRSSFHGDSEYASEIVSWSMRWSEGFFWALRKVYYSSNWEGPEFAAAASILEGHRIADFPILTDSQDEEEGSLDG